MGGRFFTYAVSTVQWGLWLKSVLRTLCCVAVFVTRCGPSKAALQHWRAIISTMKCPASVLGILVTCRRSKLLFMFSLCFLCSHSSLKSLFRVIILLRSKRRSAGRKEYLLCKAATKASSMILKMVYNVSFLWRFQPPGKSRYIRKYCLRSWIALSFRAFHSGR